MEPTAQVVKECAKTKLRRTLAKIIDEIGAPASLDAVEIRASCACAPFLAWGEENADEAIQQEIKDGFLVLDHTTRTLSYREERMTEWEEYERRVDALMGVAPQD